MIAYIKDKDLTNFQREILVSTNTIFTYYAFLNSKYVTKSILPNDITIPDNKYVLLDENNEHYMCNILNCSITQITAMDAINSLYQYTFNKYLIVNKIGDDKIIPYLTNPDDVIINISKILFDEILCIVEKYSEDVKNLLIEKQYGKSDVQIKIDDKDRMYHLILLKVKNVDNKPLNEIDFLSIVNPLYNTNIFKDIKMGNEKKKELKDIGLTVKDEYYVDLNNKEEVFDKLIDKYVIPYVNKYNIHMIDKIENRIYSMI